MDALHRLSDTWGVAARAEYGWGTSEFSVPIAPGLKLRHDQGDDRAYAQVDLVGAYTSRHWDAIPERWALHPNIGAQFQRSFIEATADSFGAVSSGVLGDTEDYAAGWLRRKLILGK